MRILELRGIFIAGTDTGVGKTEIGRALLALWAAQGLRPRALKPIETGCAPDHPEDALALRAACGAPNDSLPLDEVCPHRFLMPAAPLVAAEAEGRVVEPARIEACVARAREAGGPLLVEAAGGLLVPLWREGKQVITNLDLAERLGFPVLLVARAGLGTVNHSALSAMALAQRKLELLAIVLNRTGPGNDPTYATNSSSISELTKTRVIGPGNYESDASKRSDLLRSWLEQDFVS